MMGSAGNLLHKALSDPAKYAFAFQIKVAMDLIERDSAVYDEVVRERDAISSGEIFTEVATENGHIIGEGMEIVRQLCGLQQRGKTSLYIYLRVDPSVALERIRERDRLGEYDRYSANDCAYLQQLFRAHERVFARG
jgi:deoxyadenosine/deoxycytidine kinase